MDQPQADTLPQFANKVDFLAWEEAQEMRFEFDGEDVAEVTGGTENHITIIANLAAELRSLLRGTRFRVLPQIKVETIPGFRYPDVSVAPRGGDGTSTIFRAPIVLFEVLSPSTRHIDLGRKRVEYAALLSVRRYVVVEHRFMGAGLLSRGAADGWTETSIAGGDAVLDLPEIGVSLRLADCYEDVVF